MHFTRPTKQATMSHEEWVAQEAQRLAWQREKAAARRQGRVVYHDEETTIIETPKPIECSVDDCRTKPKARALCPRHYKQARRLDGHSN